MRDIFYGLIAFFIVLYFYSVYRTEPVYTLKDMSPYNGGIIVDKDVDFMGTNFLNIHDTTQTMIRCSDYVFMQYEVGDTIKTMESK